MPLDHSKMGARIKSFRTRQKLSQDALAEKASIGRAHLSRIENGEKGATLETVLSIANALGVSANDLLIDSLNVLTDTADIPTDFLLGCSPEEISILTENMAALKSILKNYRISK